MLNLEKIRVDSRILFGFRKKKKDDDGEGVAMRMQEQSVGVVREKVFLMGEEGVYLATLLGWSERVDFLQVLLILFFEKRMKDLFFPFSGSLFFSDSHLFLCNHREKGDGRTRSLFYQICMRIKSIL